MRSYGQFCPLAKALDVVGDRWTLLIMRELFIRESRYSDLRHGLPGIATNLLAERLRQLESHGIVEARHAPRPIGATVYRLSRRGRELGPAIRALADWGVPLLADASGGDEFRAHWTRLGIPLLFEGVSLADLAPLTVILRAGDEAVTLRIDDDGLAFEPDNPPAADVVVEGSAADLTAFIQGRDDTRVVIEGDHDPIGRLRTLIARSRITSST